MWRRFLIWGAILWASFVSIGLFKRKAIQDEAWGWWQTYAYAPSYADMTPVFFVIFLALCYYAFKPAITMVVGKRRAFWPYLMASFVLLVLLIAVSTRHIPELEALVGWDLKQEGVIILLAFHFFVAWTASFVMTVWQGWYKSFPEQERLEHEAMTAKLKTLEKELEVKHKEALLAQSQLDPHHLSNELNDLYLMVLQGDERAAESLRLLAHFMRRMIAKSGQGWITLDQEYENLRSYISYECYCHRISSPILKVIGNLEDYKHVQLPANLFLPVAENVFKYGKICDDDPPVMELRLKPNKINFMTVNSISEERKELVKQGGIGYKNLDQILATFLPGAALSHGPKQGWGKNKYQARIDIPLK